MNIREAILKAADHIERNPGEFDFFPNKVPQAAGCGTPGCAAGWIGTFSGFAGGTTDGVCTQLLGVPLTEFLARMDHDWGYTGWHHDPAAAAQNLRRYADKYHPAEATYPVRQELGDWSQCPWKPERVS